MAAQIRNMTRGKPLSLIVAFALPLMLGNVFQQLYTVVDTMVVGKALGVDALAALGAADWLNWMMLSLIQGLTQGLAIRMAREFGAGEQESLRQTIGSSALLAAMAAILFLSLGQFAARPVLGMLQTPPEIIDDALLYLRVMFSGAPIVMAYNLFACILRSLGDGKTPLYAMVVASFVNIALDLLFVLVFHWGFAGAAIATVIAQLVSGIFCLLRLRRVPILALEKRHFRLTAQMAKDLTLLGSPMALQNAIISIGGMIVQFVVNGSGVVFIAGFTATNKLYGILEIAATSYGYAMITYVGQNLGARRLDRIRGGMKAANTVAVATSLVITAIMVLLGKCIVGLFISGTPLEVAQATGIAYQYLVIMSLCLPVLYILHVVRSAVQGMGNTFLPMVSGIAEFVMRTGAALLLPLAMGQGGIFWAEPLAWLGADLILIPSYFITTRRITKKLP